MPIAAVIAAALALAGAPPSTPVTCTHKPTTSTGEAALGLAYRDHIEVAQRVCGGLLLLGASDAERRKIMALNRVQSADVLMGLGALVMLHEGAHAAGLRDETDAECRAMALVAPFLARWRASAAVDVAEQFDRVVLAGETYHARPCS